MVVKFINKHKAAFKAVITLLLSASFILGAVILIWISTFKVPTSDSIRERRVTESTKIYDRTGEILLYDTGGDVRRSVVPIEEISENIKKASISIEDKDFYSHIGVKPTAFLRAILVNILSMNFSQGGSTITQQVVKNSILTSEKLISRKLKEWVLAIKLEQVASKEEILGMYLNEIPYGGVIYGVEEASQTFFGKKSSDVTLAEAAYLAAIPKAPTFYSPYGKNVDKLEDRKNLVLSEMLEDKIITNEEYLEAKEQKVEFLSKSDYGIRAPHFVFYVIDYIKNKYGEDALNSNGLRVITTLDYDLQSIGEKIVYDYAIENEVKFNATNAALVAIDPKNGQILTMVGSRDYSDDKIDGAFNVTTAKRQPGSTFKPFVYAEAFKKGYTPDTVVFDLKTQFSTNCAPNDLSKEYPCFSPDNYDNVFRGPVTLRSALAQSLNVPSVKVLYLAGLNESIRLARDMGMESINNKGNYGLTLVLGGGEVTPLELTGAYGVFANNGVKTQISPILEIKNKNGEIIEKNDPRSIQVLEKEVALKISDVLSDNEARAPSFGQSSALHFPYRDVAVKTGTTNDYKDAWIIGYTPNIAVGAWAGNNNNTSMEKRVAGFIVAPMWRAFMDRALSKIPDERFEEPLIEDKTSLKPVLQGIWQGGVWDGGTNASGRVLGGVHSILNWVNKDNPRGEVPQDPSIDSQYERWEYGVRIWAQEQNLWQDFPYQIPNNQSI